MLDLVLDDEGDDLDPAERADLDRALVDSSAQADRGETRDASELLDEVRRRRARG